MAGSRGDLTGKKQGGGVGGDIFRTCPVQVPTELHHKQRLAAEISDTC